MKISEIAAWYAAAVATIVFLWDIYKWRMGSARLHVATTPNSFQLNDRFIQSGTDKPRDREVFVSIDIQNHGAKQTTVTYLGLAHYRGLISLILRKPTARFAADPQLGTILAVLDVGTRWFGLIKQTAQIELLAQSGYLFAVISRAGSSKPVMSRIRIAQSP